MAAQTYIHTSTTPANAVTLVWGSLRLAPIVHKLRNWLAPFTAYLRFFSSIKLWNEVLLCKFGMRTY